MRIFSVSSINGSSDYYNRTRIVNNNSKSMTNFKGAPFFAISYWDDEILNILGRNSKQMKELGRVFHNKSESELRKIAKVRTDFFGITKPAESEMAYNKLLAACEEVRKEKEALLSKLSVLKSKKYLTQYEKDEYIRIQKEIDDLNRCTEQASHYRSVKSAEDDPYAGMH